MTDAPGPGPDPPRYVYFQIDETTLRARVVDEIDESHFNEPRKIRLRIVVDEPGPHPLNGKGYGALERDVTDCTSDDHHPP